MMMPTVQGHSKQYSNQKASISHAAPSKYYLSDYSPIVPMIQSGLGCLNEKEHFVPFHRVAVTNAQGEHVDVSLDRLVQASKKLGFDQFFGFNAAKLIKSIKERWSPKKSVIHWYEATQVNVSSAVTRQTLYSEYTKLDVSREKTQSLSR